MRKLELKTAVSAVLAIVAGAVPLIVVPPFGDTLYMPKLMTIEVLVFGLLLLYVRPITEYFTGKPKIPLPVKLVLLYLLCVTITLPFSTDVMLSLKGRSFRLESYSAILFYGILMMLGAFFYTFKPWHVRLYAVGVSCVAVYGIFQKFGLDFQPQDPLMYGGPGASYATIGNPNFLGSFLTLALPILIYAFIRGPKAYLLPCGLVYFCLLCTNTRGAWIGSLLGFVLLGVFLLGERENRRLFAVVSGVFALLTLVFLLVNSGFGARFLSVFADLSKMLRGDDWEKGGSYRLFIWSKTLELIRMRPLTGFGIETLGQVMGQYFEKDIIRVTGRHLVIDRAHNEYLHIAVSSGIPAALSYLAFEGTTLYRGLKNWRRSLMLVPLVCSIAAYMAAACFNISVVTVAPVFWIFCGIAVRLSGEIQSNLNMI